MYKSAEVSKYEPEWQIIRSIVKGNYNNDLEKKFSLVLKYLNQNTYDRWERVYNWTEGLLLGFKNKDNDKVSYIQDKLNYLTSIKPSTQIINYNIDYDVLKTYNDDCKINLYKDLFDRNSKWLKGGYFNNELNEFMDILLLYINDFSKIEKKISLLEECRYLSKTIKKTYKFVYH